MLSDVTFSFVTLARRATIVILLQVRGPAAIAWFVVSAVIDAVEGVETGWPTAHVFQKVFVGNPALAYGDATTAVIWKLLMGFVSTAAKHLRPSAILGSLLPVAALAVPLTGGAARFSKVYPEAATGFGLTGAKLIPGYDKLLSAVTLATPAKLIFVPVFNDFRYNESAETKPGHVFC
jgi:hypothetical protein